MIDQETFNAQLEASFHDELEKIALTAGKVNAGIDTVRTAVQKARAAPSYQNDALITGMRRRLNINQKPMTKTITHRFDRAKQLRESPMGSRVGKAGDAVRAQAQRLRDSAQAYSSGREHLQQLTHSGAGVNLASG
jgi:hypothetical protein